ncbi:TetR/AcrR family transcriptional regulator [Rothia nasimurium]|uniref:TetR/AcrR family transcriptional regulator n=1 Tax=Rothia nasimurium TaxID=85336 RepID=UPI003BA1D109
MGRPLTFDREQAIAQARNLFWAQGYEATAVPDLEKATGLKRSSIYHAFGSKKGLFDEVIENYLAQSVRPLLTPLTAQDAAPDALRSYFAHLEASFNSTTPHPGCLLIAAANSPIGADPSVGAAISGYYDELLAAFRTSLGRARPNLTDSQLDHQSRTLVALTVSALALARTNRQLALANLHTAQELLATKN